MRFDRALDLTVIITTLFAGDYSECGWCWGKDGEVFHRQQGAWNDVTRAYRVGSLPRTRAVGLQRCAVQRRGLGGYTELAAQRQGGGSLQSGKIWNWIQLRLPHHRFAYSISVWVRGSIFFLSLNTRQRFEHLLQCTFATILWSISSDLCLCQCFNQS